MQTDKDLFNFIKEAYPLTPREEFVSSTSVKLKQRARKETRKKKIKKFTMASVAIAFCTIAITLFFQAEKDIISNNPNSAQEATINTSTNQEPLVYIFHTHNLESFFPETKLSKAYDDTKNISLVGEKLGQSLEKKGITTIHNKTDVMSILDERGLSMNNAYEISRIPLEKALVTSESIKMVFDIHRDGANRNVTTTILNGKEYAKIRFVVSASSTKYEENLKFAELLHNRIEEKYPGLSRGVIVKDNPSGQNNYNHDLLDNSVLLDIGGTENSLDEAYRTADVFSEIIKEILSDK